MKRALNIFLAIAMILCAVSVTAFAEEETVTVTFDENNGSPTYTIEVKKGEILHELPLAEMSETLVATGWYSDKEATKVFDINQPVTEDITIYAGWHTPMAFTDVKENSEFYSSICNVYYRNIMRGISETEFGPNDFLTRAMLVTILYRFEGEPAFMNDLVFNDVEKDSYYEKAVVWANGKGIVYGISETEFNPDANITREQLATILYRYANYKEIPIEEASADTNTLSFDDIMYISEYARPAVHCCLATGVLCPRGTNIAPAEFATRAEAANAITSIGNITVPSFAQLSYNELAGSYEDSVSKRAVLTATALENGLSLLIHWGNSASETVSWTMDVTYMEDGTLGYTNCTRKTLTMNNDGHETEKIEYENGEGYFTVADGTLVWNGAADENCKECVFEKIPEELEDGRIVGMANPMAEVTEDEFMSKLGIELGTIEGAANVKYFMINNELGEMVFTIDNMEYTARVKATPEFEDISGMYFDWTVTEDCTIKGRAGKTMRYISEEKSMYYDLCLWYDAESEIMYSLSTYDKDLWGFDITAVAENFFTSVQG